MSELQPGHYYHKEEDTTASHTVQGQRFLLLDLPLEIQSLILRKLDGIHYLTLLLTCKDMGPIVKFAIKKPHTKKDCSLGHWIVERDRREILASFICSKCGKFRPKDHFGDTITISGALEPQLRWCIGCNFKELDPEIYHFTQDGVSRALCYECKGVKSLPLYLHSTSRNSYNVRCKSCLTRRYGRVWTQGRKVTILESPILYDHQRMSPLSRAVDFGIPVPIYTPLRTSSQKLPFRMEPLTQHGSSSRTKEKAGATKEGL